MIFSLDVRRARKGDCLLIHYGTATDPGLVLIDAGPANVYKPQLKPRLAEIRKARGLDEGATLPVNLMMVSHIDDDHINGILQLTHELVDAQDFGKPLPLKIRSFWHNTFDDIIRKNPKVLLAAVTASFGTASLAGEVDEEGMDPAAARVLAGVSQGIELRDDAKKLGIPLNSKFTDKLVMASDDGAEVELGKGLKFQVAGPMKAELLALQKDHDKFLEKQEREQKAKDALASFTDKSVANLSSLVLLAKVEDRTILLTGDARGDKVLAGLEFAGILKAGGTLHVDILKMPHHGSDRNMDNVFFQRVTADHYVFSGNGQHGNPERSTLQMLLDESGDNEFEIHITYPLDEIDVEREADWNKERKSEMGRKAKKPDVIVRPEWAAEKNSLTAFFEQNKDFAKKVRIVPEGKPHVIDLLDPLGF